MDKNLIMAITLSMGVYFVWYTFVQKPVPPEAPKIHTAAKSPGGAGVAAPDAKWQEVVTEAKTNLKAAKKMEPARASLKIPLTVPQADIQLGRLGASIASYRFRGPLGQIELVENPEAGLLATWPELEFEAARGDDKSSAVWTARHPAGFSIRKEFRFLETGKGMHQLKLALTNTGKQPVEVPAWDLSMGPGLGTVESERKENAGILRTIAMYPPEQGRTKGDLRVLKPESGGFFSSKPKTDGVPALETPGPVQWVAVDNRYFLAAVVPPKDVFERYRVEEPTVNGERAPAMRLLAKSRTLAPGESAVYEIPFYLGPKSYKEIESFHLGLERSVDFGWFDAIGRVVLRVLQVIYKTTGNYGWAIILLTLLIQLLVFPLTYKSLKATAGMRKIQPEIAKLQQKYKEDAQRLNMEMMELYKSKGVNPMGGCLPMLVQMPVFVALYNTLRGAWELHGAPWMFWVKDLSAHDPFYILPVTMGGIMFFQNKMNPAMTSDPTQAKMMLWMPVIFTFMFLKFPAGLVLYWLTNSLMGVVQQLALRKKLS
ncbi:MAG: membrane protein insertase YidC [Elusimicrobia bacterium]|nr:membrane protein insertase YidC [Elusimicrobiota bacterium]